MYIIRFTPFLFMFMCAVWQALALAQEDSEPRAALPRGLLKRGLLAKGKTTTTTTPPPQEDIEYEDDVEYQEGESQEPSTEAPPSSTEGKKLVAGGVRPFRSNNDLLETLKRRRAQAAEAKLHGHSSAPVTQEPTTEAPAKTSFNKKRFTASKDSNTEEVAAPTKLNRSRFGRPSSRAIYQETDAEEQSNDAAPVSIRAGRTFVRRGGN